MRSLLALLTLTTGTQVCLLANQLLTLPLQIRAWGAGTTTAWIVTASVAGLVGINDLGLRNAGHASLLDSTRRHDRAASLEFRAVWALTRALMIGLTLLLLATWTLVGGLRGHALPPWAYLMTAALGIDTLLIIRGMWLDTLGHFNKVEAVFLVFVAARVLLNVALLGLVGVRPEAFASVMLATSMAALLVQAVAFRRPASLSLLSGGFSELRWRGLRVVPYVLSEPATNYARISLPVVVLASMTSPRFITTYVALRAVFGLARQVTNQLARFASVGYVQHARRDRARAETIAVQSILMSTTIGCAVASIAIVDKGRLLRLWLGTGDPAAADTIALFFAVPAVTYGYQVMTGILTRSGEVANVARGQYTFLAGSLVAASIGWLTGSAVLYLALVALQEAIIAGQFAFSLGPRIRRTFLCAAAAAAAFLSALRIATALDPAGLFGRMTAPALALSLVIASLTTAAVMLSCLGIARRERALVRVSP